jgi:hypothetical protein
MSMGDLFLQLVFFGSIGALVYMASRALPRMDEEGDTRPLFRGVLSKLPTHKADAVLSSLTEKTLRRLKVTVLRVDNGLNHYLGRVKSNSAGRQKSIFDIQEKSETDV